MTDTPKGYLIGNAAHPWTYCPGVLFDNVMYWVPAFAKATAGNAGCWLLVSGFSFLVSRYLVTGFRVNPDWLRRARPDTSGLVSL